MLPELAREVSSAIPSPEYVSSDPLCMGYARIDGRPMSADVDGIWPERLGRFLYDLHLTPPEFVGLRSTTAAAVREGLRHEVDVLSEHVLPLLSTDERTTAERTLAAFLDDDDNFRFATGLTHGDIGPAHVLVTDSGDLAGVIDWGDLEVGDPVFDLTWVIHAIPEVGERVLGAYGGPPDDRFVVRSRFAFMLMPVARGEARVRVRAARVRREWHGRGPRAARLSAGSTFSFLAATMERRGRLRATFGTSDGRRRNEMTDEDKSVVDKAKGAAGGAVDKAKDVTGDLVEQAKPLVDKAGGAAISAFDKAKDVTGDVVEKAKPLVGKAGEVAGGLLDKAKEKLATDKTDDGAPGAGDVHRR